MAIEKKNAWEKYPQGPEREKKFHSRQNQPIPKYIQGTLDTAGVAKRRQARSKYGAKRPKDAKK